MTEPNRCLYTDEYCDGWRAHQRGEPADGNPYESATGAFYHKRYNWRAGWFEAQRQAEKELQP